MLTIKQIGTKLECVITSLFNSLIIGCLIREFRFSTQKFDFFTYINI
jgi:hypothetical protein